MGRKPSTGVADAHTRDSVRVVSAQQLEQPRQSQLEAQLAAALQQVDDESVGHSAHSWMAPARLE
jgi:hypothetical protein